MKEKTKKKFLGKRFYAIYRRYRYLRYVKQLRKLRLHERKMEDREEKEEFRATLKKQIKLETESERQRIKRIKREEKEEKKAIRKDIRAKLKAEKELEKQKITAEKKRLKNEQEEVKIRLEDKLKSEQALIIEQKSKRKELKRRRKHKLRRMRSYLIRRRLREIRYSIRSINKDTFKRWRDWFINVAETRTDRNTFVKIAVNSLSLFVLSHLVIFFIGQFITILTALSFDYETVLYYYKIYYNIKSSDWTGDAVKILYSIKPLTGLLLGFISLIIYNTNQNKTGKFKMFFLWGFVHGMVLFFGSLLMGTLLSRGFGWVIAYLYYKDTGKMIFSILSIFALVISGSSIARKLLVSGNSYFNFIDSRNRKFLIMSQVIIPVILGTIILSLLKIPPELYYTTNDEVNYEVLKLWAIILVVIPVIFTMNSYGEIFFDEEPRRKKVNWIFFLITLAVILAIWYFLYNGWVISPE